MSWESRNEETQHGHFWPENDKKKRLNPEKYS